jgi:hypothetical protein
MIWDRFVRGWMKIDSVKDIKLGFRCHITGKDWESGRFMLRTGEFHPIKKKFLYLGFQGIRQFVEGFFCTREETDNGSGR